MRVGIGLFTGQVPAGSGRSFGREYAETIELVRLAESTGFDSAWVSEHHGSSDGYLPSLLAFLAALASATRTIRLGTGLLLAPLHHPLRVAEDAAVVDQISGGRLVLGLGLGWRVEEFRMFGLDTRTAAARLEDTINVLRLAWTGKRFSYEGRALSFDRVRVTPPPARRGGPPILVGGYVDAAFRRAGRLADGHTMDTDDPDLVARAVSLMDAAARERGRDPASLSLVLNQNAWVVDDPSVDAWAQVREGVIHQWGAYEAWEGGHDTPAHDSLEPRTDEAAARAATAAGTPEDVARRLRAIAEPHAGRDLELVVRLHYPGMELDQAAAAVRLFGERVLPALR